MFRHPIKPHLLRGRLLVKHLTTSALLLLLLSGNATFALDPNKSIPQYVHEIYAGQHGLPQNTILGLVQTPDGYIWVGTQEGLARFDGVQFTVFDTRNTPELKTNMISTLAVSRDGSLWIPKSEGGITRFKDGQFKTYTSAEGLAGEYTMSVGEDSEGGIWVGTVQHGASRFYNGQFTNYTTADGLIDNNVWAVGLGQDNSVWLGTPKGLSRFKDGRFTNYTTADGLTADYIKGVNADRRGNLWISTAKGLTLFRDGKFTRFDLGSPEADDNTVYCTLEDRHGNLWIASLFGLYRFRDGRLDVYKQADGLAAGPADALCEDSEGNLWVGSSSGGINKFSDGKFTAYTVREGLARDPIWVVYGDRSGNLWAGVSRGGLNLFKDGRFTPYEPAKAIADKGVFAIYEDRSGNLWASSRGGQLNQFKGGKMSSYLLPDYEINNDICAITEDLAGNLWVGTRLSGLKRFVNGQFIEQEGLPPNSQMAACLVPSRDGSLWIGTGAGLYRLADGRMQRFGKQEGLSAEHVYSVYEDGDNNVWIATQGGGLNRYRDGRFTAYTSREGLFDDVAFQVMEDAGGYLWMSGNKGVYNVRKQQLDELDGGLISQLTSVSYGTGDGMASRECNGGNQPSGCIAADGSMWFPTIKGAAQLRPANQNPQTPPVYVEQVTIDQKAYAVGQTITAPPGRGDFQFHYTALSYQNPAKVKFKVKLQGYDDDWVDVGTRREAFYTNIAPGDYQFRVMACNNEGVWNEMGAPLSLTLKPYFYQTWWFYISCALLLIGAAFAGYRYRVGRMEVREQELQQLVAVRTSQLESANQKLYELTILDEMTGVANHRRFKEVLDAEWKRAGRQASAISLALIDIDYFKNYNDAYGHQAGDECLRRVAAVMRETVNRPTDLVARYGGEEFAVILTDTDEEGAAQVAEAIRKGVEALRITHADSNVSEYVTISVGVSTMTPQGELPAKEMIENADQSLYDAKHRGRNQTVRGSSVANYSHIS
jgi:diguanylate cyclase (GGDEF)-like protein